MTHLSNLQRDQFHLNLNTVPLTYGAPGALGTTIKGNSDGIVSQDFSHAFTYGSVANTAGNWSSFGVLLAQPLVNAEFEPYRVKAYIQGTTEGAVVIGYAPLAPSGTNDDIVVTKPFPITKSGIFDEVIRLKTSVTYDGQPIYFGIAAGEGTELAVAHISVQRMSVASPQYSSSTS